MGRVANGLPGQNVGQKQHGYFMMGHAAGYTGKPRMSEKQFTQLSKACQKAYERGYARGAADKAKKEQV